MYKIGSAYQREINNYGLVFITFASVEKILPLQAADMMATESYWHVQKWLENKSTVPLRAHFKSYLAEIGALGEAIGRSEFLQDLAQRNSDGLIHG